MTELSDQTLLSYWYRNRNAEAFRIIATRHTQMVFATAMRILRNVTEAEDVAQESFLELAITKRPPKENAAAWLHRTTYRKALNYLRTSKRRRNRDDQFSSDQTLSSDPVWNDLHEHVDEAIAQLPASLRDAIVLYFFEEMTHAQIVESMGVSRQAITKRVGKGIEQVRANLSAKGITTPAATALATLIHENTAIAVPPQLATSLGRIALGAMPSFLATVSTISVGVLVKALAVVSLVGLAGFATYDFTTSKTPSTPPIQNAVPLVVVADTDGDATSEAVESIPGRLSEPTIDEPESVIEPTITLAQATQEEPETPSHLSSVSGTITLPDGQPFFDANITLLDTYYLEKGGFPEGTRFVVQTDSQGHFQQLAIAPAEYSIAVTEPRSETWNNRDNEIARVTLKAGEHRRNVDFVFGTEGDLTVSGVVVDSSGNPIEDVRVHKFRPVPREAWTDSMGRFTPRYLPADEISIHASKKEYTSDNIRVPAGYQNARLVLLGQGGIAGRVIDAITKEPITEFEASFMNHHHSTFRESLFGNKKSFESSDGAFAFPKVYSGDVTLVARAPGYPPALILSNIVENETVSGLVIELNQADARTIIGQVIAADGRPISGANIYIDQIPYDDQSADRHVLTTTDEQGRFQLEEVASSVKFVGARHPEFAPASGIVTHDTTIVLPIFAKIEIELVSNGKPVPDTKIYTEFMEERNLGYIDSTRTNEKGIAIKDDAIPGRIHLRVKLGENREQRRIISVEPGEEKFIRIEVAPGEAEVDGFLQENGAGSKGRVTMFVQTDHGSEYFTQWVNPDGSFLFRDLPIGKAQLIGSTNPGGRRVLFEHVELVPGKVTSLNVNATGAHKIYGQVSGILGDDKIEVAALSGARSFEEAVNYSDRRGQFDWEPSGYSGADEEDNYSIEMNESGTYTLVIKSYAKDDYTDSIIHESRVVEVSEDQALIIDFNLNY